MSLEENKAIVHRLYEALNTRNLSLLDELMAPDYVDYTRQIRGREVLKQIVDIWRIVDGKIVECWAVDDMLDFYKQLGVIEYKGFPDEK